jgi:hypothetical protein
VVGVFGFGPDMAPAQAAEPSRSGR